MGSHAGENELVIGAVNCPRLALYASFLVRKGYKVTQTPGSACSALLACGDHLAEQAVASWGRELGCPKFVLSGDPPADWRDAVRLDLPLLPLNLEQRILAAQPPGDPSPGSSRAYDVVVVDDDATIRAAVTEALGTVGLRVRGCSGFADLTGALLKGRPDFIVLDLNLPGISGESLGGIIRNRNIPTAVFSSAPSEEIASAQQRIGAIMAFSKTTSLVAMGRWIRRYIDRQGQ